MEGHQLLTIMGGNNIILEFGQLLTINNSVESSDRFKLGKHSHPSSKDIAIDLKQVDETTRKEKLSQRDNSNVKFVDSNSDISQISKDNSNQLKTDAENAAGVGANVSEVNDPLIITDLMAIDLDLTRDAIDYFSDFVLPQHFNRSIPHLLSYSSIPQETRFCIKKVNKLMDAESITLLLLSYPISSDLHDLKEKFLAPSAMKNLWTDHTETYWKIVETIDTDLLETDTDYTISKWFETDTYYTISKLLDEKFELELSAGNKEQMLAQTFSSKLHLLYSSLGEFATMVEQLTHNYKKHDLVSLFGFTSSKRGLITVVEQLNQMQYFEKDKLATEWLFSFAVYMYLRQQSGAVEQFSQHDFERTPMQPVLLPTTNQERFPTLRSELDTNRLDYMRRFRPVKPQGQSQDYLAYTRLFYYSYLLMLQPHDPIQTLHHPFHVSLFSEIDPLWQVAGSQLNTACLPFNAINGVIVFTGNGNNGGHPNGKSTIVKFKIPKDNSNSFDDGLNDLSGSNPDEEQPPQEGTCIPCDGIPPDNTQSSLTSKGHHSKGDAHASVSIPPDSIDSPDKLQRSGEELMEPPDHYTADELSEVDNSNSFDDGLNDFSGSNPDKKQPQQEGIPFDGTSPNKFNTQSPEGHHSKGVAHASASIPPDLPVKLGRSEEEQMGSQSTVAVSPDHYAAVSSNTDPKFLSLINEVDESKDTLNDLSGSDPEQLQQESIPIDGAAPDNTHTSEGHHSKGDAHASVSITPDSINSLDKLGRSDPKFSSQDEITSYQKLIFNVDANSELGNILCNIQMQFEAMNYEEMKYMLSKLTSLAKSDDESAVILFAEGLANFMLKEYEESFEKFRQVEIILQKLLRSENSSVCFMYMGDAESNQGHYKSAPEYFEKAIACHQHHSQPSQLEKFFNLERTTLSTMLSKHALSLRNDDRVVDSEKRYKQAMSCPDATPSDIIIAHTGLGNLLHSLGSNEKAVPEYLAAIDIAEREKDYLSLAWAHGNLGNTYLSLGKREKGLSHLQTSLNLTLEYDFDPSSISRALNNLGTAYQSLNELDKAELYFDQALSQAIYANDVVGQARAYGNIGNVYMLLKDFLKAIPHYTEVLRLSRDRSTVYVAYHNRGCALFELAEKKKGEQYQFTKRGEFQFIAIGPDTGDMDYKHQPDEELDDHTTELYQQSLKDLKKVIKNVESAFANSSSSTIGLDLYLSLFHINAKTFQRAQDCAFNLRDHYQSLTIAEQVRARTLGELLLKRKSHQLPTAFSTPLNIDAIKLAVELLPDPYTPVVVLSYTGTRLLVWVLIFDGKTVSVNSFEQEPDDELFGKQLDTYLRYELADDLTGNIDLYGEEEERENEFEEEGEKTDEEKEIESDDEKKQESDEEEKKEDAKKYSDNIDSNKLDDTEILEKATEPVKKEKGDKKSGPAKKRKILSDLYKMIAKPLEAILKAVIPEPILHSKGPHKLILIPDNSTKMIPFNALLNEERGVYFGDKHTLQFFPSILCLGIMSQTPPTVIRINGNTTGDVLIVGDPSTPAFKFEGEDWTPGPLPHAKKEAEWVGHYMGTPPLLGGEPTKEVVLAKLSQAKLIHLATHGSATYGFVLLAGHCYDRQTTFTSSLRYPEDEKKLLLYASEIESLRLQSCLVILSSCDSGRGKFKGDEIQGMSRSFLLAGAAAVMTSLWKVPDQSASYFMQYFYRYLLDGHTSSVSLQKSIQSIRSIHHFSQVIHWGGYQLTGSDVRIMVEVSDKDTMVFKALGCPGGVSPFPRLELLQKLENNLFSSTENNVQIIYGPCGTNPTETINDFIAKHHSAYHSIYWCNASHSVVMNDVIKIMEKVVCDYGDHQSSMLLVVDSATADNVADLIPLSRCKNIQLILVAHSISDYKEIAREVDIKLKMGVNSLPAVKPLTELECAQRIVYSLVRNEENDINHYDSKDINSLASSCSGSPSVVKMAEQVAAAGKSALKIDDDEDLSVLDVELKSCHKEVIVVKLSRTKKEVKEYSSSLHISSIMDSLCLSPVSHLLLNCLSVFHGVPIPKLFLSSLENEIINASSSSSSGSPLTSLSLSSLSSSHITALDCIAELLMCQCIVSYPSPVIVQSSSAKAASSIDTTLYTVPDIISEYMWSNMDTVDKLFAIGIAYRTIKRKAKNMAIYSHGLVNQLLERFEDIENGPSSDVAFDEKTIQEIKDDCYILLLSFKELFRSN